MGSDRFGLHTLVDAENRYPGLPGAKRFTNLNR